LQSACAPTVTFPDLSANRGSGRGDDKGGEGWPQEQQEYFSVSFESAKLLKRSYIEEVDKLIFFFGSAGK